MDITENELVLIFVVIAAIAITGLFIKMSFIWKDVMLDKMDYFKISHIELLQSLGSLNVLKRLPKEGDKIKEGDKFFYYYIFKDIILQGTQGAFDYKMDGGLYAFRKTKQKAELDRETYINEVYQEGIKYHSNPSTSLQ
ncbi:hypothetical protein INR75_06655 [Zunongwangia sp. SCSIO 43204]|uniref:hypothetical protein n=1 Tax=Zunongwangia sp. SCSIO 43204 TaxID=2779359 RepID=UPI001CA9BB58|nr:hypothetical protein [Zunongwangia sp. SCSIO 43204]UAB85689.1 hypothetical protein INR75_06655 [Zunongwangia sp. SCSIO 43204]